MLPRNTAVGVDTVADVGLVGWAVHNAFRGQDELHIVKACLLSNCTHVLWSQYTQRPTASFQQALPPRLYPASMPFADCKQHVHYAEVGQNEATAVLHAAREAALQLGVRYASPHSGANTAKCRPEPVWNAWRAVLDLLGSSRCPSSACSRWRCRRTWRHPVLAKPS